MCQRNAALQEGVNKLHCYTSYEHFNLQRSCSNKNCSCSVLYYCRQLINTVSCSLKLLIVELKNVWLWWPLQIQYTEAMPNCHNTKWITSTALPLTVFPQCNKMYERLDIFCDRSHKRKHKKVCLHFLTVLIDFWSLAGRKTEQIDTQPKWLLLLTISQTTDYLHIQQTSISTSPCFSPFDECQSNIDLLLALFWSHQLLRKISVKSCYMLDILHQPLDNYGSVHCSCSYRNTSLSNVCLVLYFPYIGCLRITIFVMQSCSLVCC